MFQRAYSKENLMTETRDTLLHLQLQEGLRMEIMRALAVSVPTQSYANLCVEPRMSNTGRLNCMTTVYSKQAEIKGRIHKCKELVVCSHRWGKNSAN